VLDAGDHVRDHLGLAFAQRRGRDPEPRRGPDPEALPGLDLRAVVSLSDGAAIADPFHASAPIVELLRARAAQLDRDGRGARTNRRASRRLRLVIWR
jgi:hypothetical protein